MNCICLGESPSKIQKAVNTIKHIEETRALTILKKSINDLDDNGGQTLAMRNAFNLSEDLGEEEGESSLDHLGLITEGVSVKRRQRKGKTKSNIPGVQRGSARIEKIRQKNNERNDLEFGWFW